MAAVIYASYPKTRMIHIKTYSIVFSALLLLSAWTPRPSQAQPAPQHLSTVKLNAGIHMIRAEVALTPDQRSIGLMNRSELGVNDGMLFVFDQPAIQCFWMKNTLIPLSIAFVDDTGTILQLQDMKPQSLDEHCSSKPVRYTLEMNQGWFDKHGIKAGDRLRGGPFEGSRGTAPP